MVTRRLKIGVSSSKQPDGGDGSRRQPHMARPGPASIAMCSLRRLWSICFTTAPQCATPSTERTCMRLRCQQVRVEPIVADRTVHLLPWASVQAPRLPASASASRWCSLTSCSCATAPNDAIVPNHSAAVRRRWRGDAPVLRHRTDSGHLETIRGSDSGSRRRPAVVGVWTEVGSELWSSAHLALRRSCLGAGEARLRIRLSTRLPYEISASCCSEWIPRLH